MKKTLSALAVRRQTFVLAILEGRSAADAARAAGYKGKDANMRIRAWELLRHPDIKAKIQELAKVAATEAIATITQRLERLSEILRDNDPGDAIRAIHEMNLMQRVFHEGVDVNVQQRVLNVTVVSENARGKLLKIMDGYRTERQESVMIEGGDIKSGLIESRSEDRHNTEVNNER